MCRTLEGVAGGILSSPVQLRAEETLLQEALQCHRDRQEVLQMQLSVWISARHFPRLSTVHHTRWKAELASQISPAVCGQERLR